jgi:hypothetical protein
MIIICDCGENVEVIPSVVLPGFSTHSGATFCPKCKTEWAYDVEINVKHRVWNSDHTQFEDVERDSGY